MFPTSNDPPPSRPRVFVLDDEYTRLADLVCGSYRATAGLALLWEELKRATILPAGCAPAGLVRMGSRVTYTDLTYREQRRVRLAYPGEGDGPYVAAVTSSVGAALIGLKPREVFRWLSPEGHLRAVRVESVEAPLHPRTIRTFPRAA
jgi:regulator of nucleoside diphosphate kinase